MDIDIVIASVPWHFPIYEKLIKDFKPKAKLICHFGNTWDIKSYPYKNVMASIAPQPIPSDYNVVFYHQEIDLTVYKPFSRYHENGKKIRTFVNWFAQQFLEDYKIYKELQSLLPEYTFESYGAGCETGSITKAVDIAKSMQESMFGFHCKTNGDGFGHSIHSWFACGKPVIVRKHQYVDKLAGQLLTDGITCIDIDGKSLEQIAEKIRYYSQPEWHQVMCLNAMTRFQNTVDYDSEEKKIREFLEKLL